MGALFKNNGFSTLASGITDVALTMTVAAGEGARFPSPTGADYFYCTLIDTSNNLEIVKCTTRATDVFTIVRAQEGTTGRAYSTADRVELRITAAGLTEFVAADTTDTLTNKSIDLGTNTLTGSVAEFNAALQSESFATLGGAETLVTKTLTSPVINTGVSGTAIDTDVALTANSDTLIASQKATKAYVDANSGAGDYQEFTAAGGGTWTKPAGANVNGLVYVYAVGGGGGGGQSSGVDGGGGGGGGGGITKVFKVSALGATESTTVGAGGAGKTGADGDGAAGGATTFGSLMYAAGGGGGLDDVSGAGGVGGSGGDIGITTAAWVENSSGASIHQGGDGGRGFGSDGCTGGPARVGKDSIFGGGGGGGGNSTAVAGGISINAGAGGAGGDPSPVPVAGTAPGGGGGGAYGGQDAANGADGVIKVWTVT